MAANQEHLVFADVVAGYGRGTVLHGVSISVPAGAIVAIIGPNGAGKTTLLRTAMGLVKVRSGSIAYCGSNITSVPTDSLVQRGLVMVPEGRRIFTTLSVEENLAIGAHSRGRKFNVRKQMDKVLEYFPELRTLLTHRGSALSGGEQQMLAIARALMAEPRTLLIDEVSLGLAPIVVRRLGELFKNLRRELDVTLLLIEQGAVLASEISDVIHVMVNGTLVQDPEGESGALVRQYTDYASPA